MACLELFCVFYEPKLKSKTFGLWKLRSNFISLFNSLGLDMFNVLLAQSLVEGFPLEISCVDVLGSKAFIGTVDGSILDYNIDEDPFTITLSQVYKNVMTKPLIQVCILPDSKNIAVLAGNPVLKSH